MSFDRDAIWRMGKDWEMFSWVLSMHSVGCNTAGHGYNGFPIVCSTLDITCMSYLAPAKCGYGFANRVRV